MTAVTPTDLDTPESEAVERMGLYSFLVNVGLAILKAMLAFVSGSLVITASAVDSGTDAVASLAVWGGLKLSTRKSKTFPYGLYKVENIIQVIMALLILFTGVEIARKAFSQPADVPVITVWVIIGMALGALVPLVFGVYMIRVGRKTGSPALMADGRHRQVDVLATGVVLVAVIAEYFGMFLDKIAAAVVLVFIGYAGWELLADGMRVLLDASIDPETLNQVREILQSEPTVVELRSLEGRNAGRYRFLEAEVVLRVVDLKKAHVISQRMEKEIRERIPHVDRILIHYEPSKREKTVIAVPLGKDREGISAHFGEAPVFYIGVRRESDGKILKERFLSNPFLNEEKAKGLKVGEWLIQQGVDVVFATKVLKGKGAGYVLSDAGVEVLEPSWMTLSEAKEQWGSNAAGMKNRG